MRLRPHQEALCCTISVCLLLFLNRKTENQESKDRIDIDHTITNQMQESKRIEKKRQEQERAMTTQARPSLVALLGASQMGLFRGLEIEDASWFICSCS